MRWNSVVVGGLLPLVGCAEPLPSPTAGPVEHACIRRVVSGTELAAALAQGECGTQIVLADGTYAGEFALSTACLADVPISVRAEHPLAAGLRSPLRLTGDHATIQGLRFDGPQGVMVVGGIGNRVLRNAFTGWQGVAIRLTAGSDAEIAYNELSTPAAWDLGGELRQGISSNDPNGGLHLKAWVHHNYFHDFPAEPKPQVYASGQSDALEICGGGQTASDQRSGRMIEHNLIERHHGGYGVIGILCSGTTVRENTMLNSPGGRFDLRRGSYSQLSGNWIEDAGGSVVHGGYQQVLGNHLDRLTNGGYPDLPIGLILTAGTVPWNHVGPPRLPDGTPAHQAAYKALVVGNIAPLLEIGLQRSPAFSYAVRGTIVERQVGSIVRGLEQATIVRSRATMSVPTAVRLQPESVGPSGSPSPSDRATNAHTVRPGGPLPEDCVQAR